MKYIILERTLDNGQVQKLPIIFPKELTHAEVADSITSCTGMWYSKPVSAGFAHTIDGEFHCFGDSISLGIASDVEDSKILNNIDKADGGINVNPKSSEIHAG